MYSDWFQVLTYCCEKTHKSKLVQKISRRRISHHQTQRQGIDFKEIATNVRGSNHIQVEDDIISNELIANAHAINNSHMKNDPKDPHYSVLFSRIDEEQEKWHVHVHYNLQIQSIRTKEILSC